MSFNIDAFRARGITIPGPMTPEQEIQYHQVMQQRREYGDQLRREQAMISISHWGMFET